MARRSTFRKYGHSYHLRINSSEDLEKILALDEAHWVATNAPISTINCDATFLQSLDTDRNGRIMCHELKQAVRWLLAVLAERGGITDRSDTLHLDALAHEHEDSGRIRAAARKILARLGREAADKVSLEDVRRIKAQVEATPVSEAGVVLQEAATDGETRQFIADAVTVTGGAPHPSGRQGIGPAQLDAYCRAAAGCLDWLRRGQVPEGESSDIMPLGLRTSEGFAALGAVRAKLDQYFAQCEAAALDERFVQRMGWTEKELQDLDFDDPTVIAEVLAQAPLAAARGTRELRLDEPVNPHYAAALERFVCLVAQPVLGEAPPQTLSSAQWNDIKAFFEAHRAWAEARPAAELLAIPPERLRAALGERLPAAVRELIAASAETALELDSIRLTERLILYQANMLAFANSFVSFPDLYDPAGRAMFETGTLIMDGRRFNLAVAAVDPAIHANVAQTSNMCLLYIQVTRRAGTGEYSLAVPVTSGGKGNLCVGKRGVFHDLAGDECDAVVTRIVENPISMREAIVSPFQRLGRLFTGKIEALTASAEKKLDTRFVATMDQVTTTPVPTTSQKQALSGGMLMGAGVTIAALGSALAYISKTISQANGWAIAASILGAVLIVLLPTCTLAFLKLRRRDLSAILEGSGWGINARMRLTRAQSRYFTQRPRYPRGAVGGRRWVVATVILAAGLIITGITYLSTGLKKSQQAPSPPSSTAPAPVSEGGPEKSLP